MTDAGLMPPSTTSPVSSTASPARLAGLGSLLTALVLPVAWAACLLALDRDVPGWLDAASIFVLMVLAPVWAVRGLSRLAGWHWAAALIPALVVYAAVLLATAAWTRSVDGLGGVPGHFDALEPGSTSAAELDRAMEDW